MIKEKKKGSKKKGSGFVGRKGRSGTWNPETTSPDPFSVRIVIDLRAGQLQRNAVAAQVGLIAGIAQHGSDLGLIDGPGERTLGAAAVPYRARTSEKRHRFPPYFLALLES